MKTLNRVLVKPYKKESLRAQETNGLALNVGQKVNLAGLEVIADAVIVLGMENISVKKGSKVYVPEEMLHNGLVGGKAMSCDDLSEKFMVIEAHQLVGIE